MSLYDLMIGRAEDLKTMNAVFDEIGSFHSSDTNAAVIREEFLSNFDIQSPKAYDSMIKSGPTPFHSARKLICQAKYDRTGIEKAGGITKCMNEIQGKGTKFWKILTAYFAVEANWFFNNSLKQCCDGMMKASNLCMDWSLGPSVGALATAKQGDEQWEAAADQVTYLPNNKFDPVIMQSCAMLTNVIDDIEDNKTLSAQLFIARINNLRFVNKKSDDALKELTSEYLPNFQNDFNGLVALADIYLNRGAIKAAYRCYYTLKTQYPQRYAVNFMLRLKCAECQRLNGFESSALNEFRTVFALIDLNAKGAKDELKEMSDLLLGFVFLTLGIGDYETAEKLLKLTDAKHKLHKLASAHYHLSKDVSKASDIFSDCKDESDNPLMLALAVRAGKICKSETSEIETKLKALIEGKFAAISVVKEYCELSAGFLKEASNECLTNNILCALMKNNGQTNKMYDALKAVYAQNECPTKDEIVKNAAINSVNAPISIIANAEFPETELITNYDELAKAADAEMKAIKSDKIEAPKAKKSKGGKKKKKANKKNNVNKSRKSGKMEKISQSELSSSPKPKIENVPMEERKKWAIKMSKALPTPKAQVVSSWNAEQIGEFIGKVPIFGLNEWYGAKFRENGVTGKMFLSCNEQKLIKWGIDRKCHRARFRAEALAMKRRG